MDWINAFVNDLRYAQTAGLVVEIRLLSGTTLLKGVHDVNEEQGFVSLYAGKMLGNDLTTTKVALDQIESVTVTDARRAGED